MTHSTFVNATCSNVSDASARQCGPPSSVTEPATSFEVTELPSHGPRREGQKMASVCQPAKYLLRYSPSTGRYFFSALFIPAEGKRCFDGPSIDRSMLSTFIQWPVCDLLPLFYPLFPQRTKERYWTFTHTISGIVCYRERLVKTIWADFLYGPFRFTLHER